MIPSGGHTLPTLRPTTRTCALVLATFLAASPAVVFAQTADPEALLSEGVRLRREGRNEEALGCFRRAWEAEHTPRARAQMGFAEHALGRWQLAEAHVLEARAASTDPWVRDHMDAIERSLATLGEHLGSVTVSCEVPGAQVFVDGRASGTLPLAAPLRVPAGAVSVEVRAPGYEPFSTRVLVVPAEAPVAIDATMRPLPPPAAPAPAPPAPVLAPPAPPVAAPASVPPPRDASTWRTLAITGWAAGAAGIATGVVGLALRADQVSTFNEGCTLYSESPLRASSAACASQYQTGEGLRTVATVAFVAGAAFAVGGTVAWLLRPRATGARAWACAPWERGVTCAVRF